MSVESMEMRSIPSEKNEARSDQRIITKSQLAVQNVKETRNAKQQRFGESV